MTGTDLRATIRADRGAFDRTLAGVPPERLSDPILDGGWSVRDVLAHIAWGEREAVGVMEARALVGSPLWEASEDERNEAVVRESRSRTLDEVLSDYRETHALYLTTLERLADEELNEPERIEGLVARIPGWRPWRVIYDPGHYAEHGAAIREAFGISPGTNS